MKMYVTYQATFLAEIEVSDLNNLVEVSDAITDIDIPEGGNNSVFYKPGSFEVVSKHIIDNEQRLFIIE